jgi:Uma2 family endonuclease
VRDDGREEPSMSTAAKLHMTEGEYLELERSSALKHEFMNGEAWAMSGGTPEHSLIAANVVGELRNRLRGGPCRAYQSDLSVHVAATGLYAYPDATVICGPIELHPRDGRSALNPRVIVEVLSESSEAYDRGAKFQHYGRIATLAEYVLVAQDQRRVEHYRRLESGQWLLTAYPPGAEVELPALGVALPLGEIYEGLEGLPTGPSI